MKEIKLNGETADIALENIKKLKSIFPDAVSDGKVDFDKLRQMLGKYIETSNERYNFTWNGKGKALRMAQTPSAGTLRPCREESRNWESSQNLYIEGDNLEVMKLLQKSYSNKVKMIYIDPPYNTGRDFVYPDKFKDSIENYKTVTGQLDSEGKNISSNSETSGRYHTDWLNMMYPRLRLARNLLADDGVIFISIDDNEAANLRKICNEIFGEDNFLASFPRITKRAGKSTEAVARNNDTIVLFSKTDSPKLYLLEHTDEGFKYKDEFVKERGLYKVNQPLDYDSLQYSPGLDYPITIEGETYYPGNSQEKFSERRKGSYNRADWAWRWGKKLFAFGLKNGFIVVRKYDTYSRIYTKTYQKAAIEKNENGEFYISYMQRTKPLSTLEFVKNEYSNDNARKNIASLFESNIFEYSKPVSLLNALVKFTTKDNDLILDFFSGSSTTAHAVMQVNAEDGGGRKFIMVQLPEPTGNRDEACKAGYKNICEIGKERIRRAGNKIKKENTPEKIQNVDIGFKVFKLDTSNVREWQPDYENLELSLMNFIDRQVDGRTELDIVYEVMLKYGLELAYPVKELAVAGGKVYLAGSELIICLEDKITADVARGISGLLKELKPEICRVVFRDRGFYDDSSKANIKEILKNEGVDEFITI
ncbi:adenine-specific DNA-methyltransferase [Ruminiclostridium sufflavum DSM 19573]|uniref:Adenine-specific DNA-methyltransferase n=1 Tax=Ruminiclostridium sufflavum DSM 19573 TaxID=1121337 RepID=A0A318XKG4_9FIRM|nr:site-specific DNA-methyltransferase [Ruminiclostridium sufflavum]PYG87861.1 adenine-specific DNA-methyltransferase [Ruminiclostridium sufflavum DSM 19573]